MTGMELFAWTVVTSAWLLPRIPRVWVDDLRLWLLGRPRYYPPPPRRLLPRELAMLREALPGLDPKP